MHGWLSPEGIFYDSYNILTHFRKANEIVDWDNIEFDDVDPLTGKPPWCAERILEILGWVKLGSDEKFDCFSLTEKQAKFLNDNNIT